jgi:heme-degrading monooxygenase HmoA
MHAPQWQLAQLNIGRIVGAHMQDPVMQTFVDLLDHINALAEGSPGFVWRLKDDNNNATSLNPFGDDRVIVNMSVWDSLEALEKFVYKSQHFDVLKRRKEWFEKFGKPFMVLWYVPAGHRPTIEEAIEKLTQLQESGPSPAAFTFRERFSPETLKKVAPAPNE